MIDSVGIEILSQSDGVAASTEAACYSGRGELSPGPKAMRVSPEVGMGVIRFIPGRITTIQELRRVILPAKHRSLFWVNDLLQQDLREKNGSTCE